MNGSASCWRSILPSLSRWWSRFLTFFTCWSLVQIRLSSSKIKLWRLNFSEYLLDALTLFCPSKPISVENTYTRTSFTLTLIALFEILMATLLAGICTILLLDALTLFCSSHQLSFEICSKIFLQFDFNCQVRDIDGDVVIWCFYHLPSWCFHAILPNY